MTKKSFLLLLVLLLCPISACSKEEISVSDLKYNIITNENNIKDTHNNSDLIMLGRDNKKLHSVNNVGTIHYQTSNNTEIIYYGAINYYYRFNKKDLSMVKSQEFDGIISNVVLNDNEMLLIENIGFQNNGYSSKCTLLDENKNVKFSVDKIEDEYQILAANMNQDQVITISFGLNGQIDGEIVDDYYIEIWDKKSNELISSKEIKLITGVINLFVVNNEFIINTGEYYYNASVDKKIETPQINLLNKYVNYTIIEQHIVIDDKEIILSLIPFSNDKIVIHKLKYDCDLNLLTIVDTVEYENSHYFNLVYKSNDYMLYETLDEMTGFTTFYSLDVDTLDMKVFYEADIENALLLYPLK